MAGVLSSFEAVKVKIKEFSHKGKVVFGDDEEILTDEKISYNNTIY